MTTSLRSRTALGVVAGVSWLMLFSLRIAGAHLGGDECVALGGTVVSGECLITTAVSKSSVAHGGAFTISESLHITGSGSIVVPPATNGNTLTIDITGDFVMDVPTVTGGGRIAGDVTTPTGIGAAITVIASGDILLHGNGPKGARISSDQQTGSCSGGHGGNITLTAGAAFKSEAGSVMSSTAVCGGGDIIVNAAEPSTVGGIISSEGTTSVGRGGPITVKIGCDLTVGDAGKIISKGRDPGADLVHLEAGCGVVINGLVASTGPGHLVQNQNRCNYPDRPDKPFNTPACVEVWSGGPLKINSVAPHNGEVSANTGESGGVACCAWIALIASGDIHINGDTGGLFSVHANQTLTNGFGGLITITSTEGSVSATGLAVQAEAQVAGGRGGVVTIEAALAVILDDAQIFARGDFNSAGGFGQGGKVSVRAFNGDLSWNNPGGGVVATGDVRATGTQVPAALRGTISLTGCGSVTTTGTSFPANGTATTPSAPTLACGGAPVLQSYVTLPACVCTIPSADVGVTMTADPPTITAGDPAKYTIIVTSDGADPAETVTLTDHVPPGLTWTVGGPDGGACSISGGVLTCTFGTVPPGSTKTVTLTAPTTAANCGTLTNTAIVSADQDSNASNDSTGPVTITIACPNVGVTMTTSTPAIAAGANAIYAVVVTAGGTGSSTNVVLKDTVPPGLTWTVGGADAGACSIAGGLLTCNFGTVAQGGTKNITLTAPTTSANCGTISNTATVSAAVDSSTSNNSAGPVIITVSCPDVRVTLTTSTPSVTVGATARYAVGVTAGGTGASMNVVFRKPCRPA